jgi:bifunctional DNase/RNase
MRRTTPRVVIDGPSGPGEVDARPSDALNLALVADAPVRIEESLLDDPRAAGRTEWQQYPTAGAELVAEIAECGRSPAHVSSEC